MNEPAKKPGICSKSLSDRDIPIGRLNPQPPIPAVYASGFGIFILLKILYVTNFYPDGVGVIGRHVKGDPHWTQVKGSTS
jgi:hypothetical protein